jgi:hypothetical protein
MEAKVTKVARVSDYSQEPAAARAARQRRVQAQVDDLLTPINPADIAYRYFLR